MSEEAAARTALAAFGVEPIGLELAARSENTTFKVEAADGPYALRLHRPGYNSLEELNSERAWTADLNRAGFAVPIGIKTRDGRDYLAVTVAGGETRQAGLTRWTPGQVLAKVIEREEGDLSNWFARLGAIAADLHAHSAAWRPPEGFTRRTLDADGLMGLDPSWGPFWEHADLTPGERGLMAAARTRLHAALSALPRGPEHFGMIHADLHHGNLIIDGQELSVIDFDDAAFGWYLYDLAVSLTHQQRRADFAALQGALLAGYRTRRRLSREDEARLAMFLLVRRLAVIGWLHQRPEIEAAAYLADIKPLTCQMCEDLIRG